MLFEIKYRIPESPRAVEAIEDVLQDFGALQILKNVWLKNSEDRPRELLDNLLQRLLVSDRLEVFPVDPKNIPCNELAPDVEYKEMLRHLASE